MKQIVIGLGEVGSAIKKILGCDGYDYMDAPPETRGEYDVVHICFPYSGEGFLALVEAYKKLYKAKLVIVHSTVPIGTCDLLDAVHSPVRGIHPHLEEGIRTFPKFFGGRQATVAAGIFREKGIQTITTLEARETEALKLWDTTIYGWNILLQKAIKAHCDENGLDFDFVYKLANKTYNQGYAALGHPEFSKYILKDFPGPIGGHCVRENWELLNGNPIAQISKDLHKKLTGE